MTRHLRGEAVYQNALEVRLVDAEQAVLAAVEHDVLNAAVLETSLYKAIAALQGGDGAHVRLAAMRDEFARIDAEVGRLAQAIAWAGIFRPSSRCYWCASADGLRWGRHLPRSSASGPPTAPSAISGRRSPPCAGRSPTGKGC
jgi:hypothetical protein